jgi:hypothetical protein
MLKSNRIKKGISENLKHKERKQQNPLNNCTCKRHRATFLSRALKSNYAATKTQKKSQLWK